MLTRVPGVYRGEDQVLDGVDEKNPRPIFRHIQNRSGPFSNGTKYITENISAAGIYS